VSGGLVLGHCPEDKTAIKIFVSLPPLPCFNNVNIPYLVLPILRLSSSLLMSSGKSLGAFGEDLLDLENLLPTFFLSFWTCSKITHIL
jgi:hypothetical protein